VDRARLPAAALYPSRVFFSAIEINRGYNSHARRRQPREIRRSPWILLLGSLRRIYGTLARGTHVSEKKEGGKKEREGKEAPDYLRREHHRPIGDPRFPLGFSFTISVTFAPGVGAPRAFWLPRFEIAVISFPFPSLSRTFTCPSPRRRLTSLRRLF